MRHEAALTDQVLEQSTWATSSEMISRAVTSARGTVAAPAAGARASGQATPARAAAPRGSGRARRLLCAVRWLSEVNIVFPCGYRVAAPPHLRFDPARLGECRTRGTLPTWGGFPFRGCCAVAHSEVTAAGTAGYHTGGRNAVHHFRTPAAGGRPAGRSEPVTDADWAYGSSRMEGICHDFSCSTAGRRGGCPARSRWPGHHGGGGQRNRGQPAAATADRRGDVVRVQGGAHDYPRVWPAADGHGDRGGVPALGHALATDQQQADRQGQRVVLVLDADLFAHHHPARGRGTNQGSALDHSSPADHTRPRLLTSHRCTVEAIRYPRVWPARPPVKGSASRFTAISQQAGSAGHERATMSHWAEIG